MKKLSNLELLKAAGYWSELFGSLVNPINLYGGSAIGAIAAPLSETRTLDKQMAHEDDMWKNLLIPGWAGHNLYKRIGHSMRGEGGPGKMREVERAHETVDKDKAEKEEKEEKED